MQVFALVKAEQTSQLAQFPGSPAKAPLQGYHDNSPSMQSPLRITTAGRWRPAVHRGPQGGRPAASGQAARGARSRMEYAACPEGPPASPGSAVPTSLAVNQTTKKSTVASQCGPETLRLGDQRQGGLGDRAGNLCLLSLLSLTLGDRHTAGKGLSQMQVLGTGSWTSSKVCLCNLRKFFLQGQVTPRTFFWTSAWTRGKMRPCYPWRVGGGRPSFLGLVGTYWWDPVL